MLCPEYGSGRVCEQCNDSIKYFTYLGKEGKKVCWNCLTGEKRQKEKKSERVG